MSSVSSASQRLNTYTLAAMSGWPPPPLQAPTSSHHYGNDKRMLKIQFWNNLNISVIIPFSSTSLHDIWQIGYHPTLSFPIWKGRLSELTALNKESDIHKIMLITKTYNEVLNAKDTHTKRRSFQQAKCNRSCKFKLLKNRKKIASFGTGLRGLLKTSAHLDFEDN